VKGRVISKIQKVIFGEMDVMDIETIYIERYNLTTIYSISRLVRKSICFSKYNQMADNYIDFFQCYNNLKRVNSAL
jgi:IS1 family transposase